MKKNKILLILFIITILFSFSCGKLIKYKKLVKELKIENINISSIKNGIYEGYCDLILVTSKVKVKVTEGRITKIDLLEHTHGEGYGADAIVKIIIEKQSLQIDTISGATGSSKAILKSVEDALKKGM